MARISGGSVMSAISFLFPLQKGGVYIDIKQEFAIDPIALDCSSAKR
jgi:hypothetical protein